MVVNASLLSRLQTLVQERGPLLALDTSQPFTAACWVGGTPPAIHELPEVEGCRPSEALSAAVAEACRVDGLALESLGAMVVGLGPGSFTGLRVGLAFAKGVGLAAGVPLIGVSSFAIVAATCGPGPVVVATDARQGAWFCAAYRVDADHRADVVLEDAARTPDDFLDQLERSGWTSERLTLVGDQASELAHRGNLQVAASVLAPQPVAALALVQAEDRLRRGDFDPLDTLAPRYLRASEAERKQQGGSS